MQAILKNAAETGNVKDRKRSGHPPSTTAREDRLLYHLSLSNRSSTMLNVNVKRDIQDATGTIVSSKTVRRLVKAGLTGCVFVKRALLTSAHNGRRCSGLMNQCLRVFSFKKSVGKKEEE